LFESVNRHLEKGKPSYDLVIYSAEMADKISKIEVDADFVVALLIMEEAISMKKYLRLGIRCFFG